VFQDPAILIGEFRPEFQIALDGFGLESRQHSRLEVGYLAGIVGDVVAVGIANRFATGALMQDVPNGPMNLFHRVPSAKNEEQDPRMLAVLFAGEIF
jgi:hypothetical protein